MRADHGRDLGPPQAGAVDHHFRDDGALVRLDPPFAARRARDSFDPRVTRDLGAGRPRRPRDGIGGLRRIGPAVVVDVERAGEIVAFEQWEEGRGLARTDEVAVDAEVPRVRHVALVFEHLVRRAGDT